MKITLQDELPIIKGLQRVFQRKNTTSIILIITGVVFAAAANFTFYMMPLEKESTHGDLIFLLEFSIFMTTAMVYVGLARLVNARMPGQPRRYRLWRYVQRFSTLAFALSAALSPVGIHLTGILAHAELIPMYASSVSAAGFIPLFALGAMGRWYARRLTAPTATQTLTADPRAPMVLLRSFSDDESRVRPSLWSRRRVWKDAWRNTVRRSVTLEWIIADTLSKFGPLVALGQPGEHIPPEGAARDQASGDWHNEITKLLEHGSLVVAIVGESPGFEWEVEWLARSGKLDRVLFVMPPMQTLEGLERWRYLVKRLASETSVTVSSEEDLSKALVVRFDATGRAMTLGTNKPTEKGYRRLLSQALERFGYLGGEIVTNEPPAPYGGNGIVSQVSSSESRESATPRHVYSSGQVFFATLLGYPISGMFLSFVNCRRAERSRLAAGMLLLGVLATVVVVGLERTLLTNKALLFPFSVGVSIGACFLTDELQAMGSDKVMHGEQRSAPWWNVAIILVCGFLLVSIFKIAAFGIK